MSSRAVLDSPAAVIPSAPHRLKRSSSEASIASLPTPPRTISKRKRSHSKVSSAANSEDDSDGSVSSKTIANKKRKILDNVEKDDAEEQAFWLADPSTSDPLSKPVVQIRSPSRTRSMSPEAETSYRAQKTGLISPPPSRRQPARKVKRTVAPQPSTPKKKGKGKAGIELPIRDSPNNPFLDDADVASRIRTPPRRTGSVEERPTLIYVFRGQKQEMMNPLYKFKPSSNSLLPPEHPDYSPSPACPPKLLFPEAHSRRLQPSRDVKRGRSPSPSSDVDSDDEDSVRAKPLTKLAFENEQENQDGCTPRAETESRKGRSKQPATG